MQVENKIPYVIKRDGRIVPFDQEKITNAIYKAAYAEGGHDRHRAQFLSNQVVTILNHCFGKDKYPSVEDIQDIIEKVLIENGHARTAKAFILYRNERAKVRAMGKKEAPIEREPIPYKKLWQILNWAVEHNVESIDKLNDIVEHRDKFLDLVAESEKFYEKDLIDVTNEIIKRRNELKLIIIAGPSSSGKTTTTIKSTEKLKKEGIELIALNLDNYFYNLEIHPKDEFGDYDFETPFAMDINLINEHLEKLLEGKTIQSPIFNFKTGKREEKTIPIQIKENQIILIDTLHGLFPPLTRSVPDNKKFKVYIETFAQLKDKNNNFIRWTDIRLMRRMIRDSKHRNYSPKRTIEHWHYVRRSEKRYIFPYVYTCNFFLNGYLAYELPIMKHLLFKYFEEFLPLFENDPDREDAYKRTKRVYNMLSQIKEFSDLSVVPPDSVLREFIGGSIYKY